MKIFSRTSHMLTTEVLNYWTMQFQDSLFEDKWTIYAIKNLKSIFGMTLLLLPLTQTFNIFIHKLLWTDVNNLDFFSSSSMIVLYIVRNVLYLAQVCLFYRTYYSEKAKQDMKQT